MVSLRHDSDLRGRIAGNLSTFERRSASADGLIPAAVAFAIVGGGEAEAAFVLTRRPSRLRRHGGQWSLPGGRYENGETAAGAALRELREEVGLSLSAADVLGLLDDFPTRSGFRITPVVVWGPPSVELEPDPEEVEAAYLVTLRALYAPGVPWIVPGEDAEPPLLTVPLESPPTVVYAPTAALIYQFRDVALEGRATRVLHFREPPFAWR
jgi:8-oxo-dGTP pyrophosphatase MutT (NUDIX family)